MVCNEHVLNMLMNMNSSALSSGVPFQTQECLPIEGNCDALWQLLEGLLCQSTGLASISKAILLGVGVRDRSGNTTRVCFGLAQAETQCKWSTYGDPWAGKGSWQGGWHLSIPNNDTHHPPLPHTLPWTCHSNFAPKTGGCHGGDCFSTEKSSHS